MGFTTPCFMVVEDIVHATRLLNRLKGISGRKLIGSPIEVSFPCFCAISTDMIFFGDKSGLDGFIDCGNKEPLFFALAALTDNDDYWMQWLVKDESDWIRSVFDKRTPLVRELGYRRATAEELIAYFG